MPKVIKKRIGKKEQAGENLAETVSDLREKLQERQQTLVYSLFAFAAVVIVVGAIVLYTRVSASKASDLQYEGYKLYAGETTEQFATPDDRLKKALEKFQKSYEAKKNPVVLFYIASSQYGLRNYDEAIKTLKDLTSRYSDPHIVSLAHFKSGMAYLKKGDTKSALDSFNALAGMTDSPLQDLAYLEAGKTLELMGKPDDAKAKYQELITKFPTSPLVGEARKRMGEK